MNTHESMLRIAASSDISVLLLGESGSGKEVAARFIHTHSKRAGGPFVALNCGAIAKGLAESILEGHRKGAFTGAAEERLGVVRSADHGTLFLDEIGEMPLETQCKLLRILQEHSVMPLGESTPIPVNFRLVCATNRDLRGEVLAGRFREDLFFRLNVFPIRIPPLRERDDFGNVAEELWSNACTLLFQSMPIAEMPRHKKPSIKPLSPHEITMLASRDWPGNVRQLKNVLQRYSLLKPHGVTLSKILDEEFSEAPLNCSAARPAASPKTGAHERDSVNSVKAYYDYVDSLYEKPRRYSASPTWELICSELTRNDGNKSVTAQKLGISRGCLNYQIKKHSS